MTSSRVKANPDADPRPPLTRKRHLLEPSAEANFTNTELQLLTHKLRYSSSSSTASSLTDYLLGLSPWKICQSTWNWLYALYSLKTSTDSDTSIGYRTSTGVEHLYWWNTCGYQDTDTSCICTYITNLCLYCSITFDPWSRKTCWGMLLKWENVCGNLKRNK